MLMLCKIVITIGLTATLAAPAVAGDSYTMDKQHTEAAFQVRHILTKVRGVFRDLEGTINFDKTAPANSSVTFRLRTASVDTGVEMRDNHLRSADFFWAQKYPEITFTSTKIVPKGARLYDVTGDLTIRGVTRQVTLPVTYLGEQKDPYGNVKAAFETAISLNRQDYGLVWNKTLDTGGLLVADQVDITVNIEAGKDAPKSSTN
jgi:polyisoprenoid-binding protein YceI